MILSGWQRVASPFMPVTEERIVFKKVQTAVFGVLILATLLILCLQRWSVNGKGVFSAVSVPVSAVAGWTKSCGSDALSWFRTQHSLLKENAVLQARAETNQLALVQLQNLEAENLRLRQALQFQKTNSWKLQLARVIGRDPSNWWRTMRIGAGSRDGIAVNQAVLATVGEAALVGRVAEVGLIESKVVLIGDPNCLVSVLVAETRNSGILQPLSSASLDPTLVKLTYMTGSDELLPGYRVYTSGLGGVFPEGIYVGTIKENISVETERTREAMVRLAANGNALEEVWVIVQ